MLGKADAARLKLALQFSKNPFFYFHDDADGIASFLLLWRRVLGGNWFMVKELPLKAARAENIAEGSDSVWILDIGATEPGFFNTIGVPIYWLDHHPIQISELPKNIKYFNSRLLGSAVPTTYLAWQIAQADDWIAAVGCIGDYHIPDFLPRLWPDLAEKDIEQLLYASWLGQLAKVFSFIGKGKSSEVKSAIAALSKIASPDEILDQSTAEGELVWKRFEKFNLHYEKLKSQAFAEAKPGQPFVWIYSHPISFTGELAGELRYLLKSPLVIIGREKADFVKCSLRTTLPIDLNKALQKALAGTGGWGGGHEKACGATLPKASFKTFLSALAAELGIEL